MNSMAWLALFVWVGVPLLASLTGVLLWRRSRTPMGKTLVLTLGVAILLAPMLVSNAVKAYYDWQVREMCAKDGGVRVYETVELPAEKFNQWGQPNFPIPITPYDDLDEADDYFLIWEITNIKFGNPKLDRTHFRLIRRSDNKVLGESVSYSRGECCLPGPGVGASYTCPDKHREVPLFQQTFISSNSGSKR